MPHQNARRLPLLAAGLLLLLASAWLALNALHRPRPAPATAGVAWTFEARRRGAILSSPLLDGDRVFAAADHSTAFTNAGAVYCLDRVAGKERWRFDDGGRMQHTFSTPCLGDGRLFIGEGMHANFLCKLYCLDAASGRKLWEFAAEGHVESGPCVASGRVFFGAGDDGLYCLDAATGRKRWRFGGPFHFDSAPAVRGGRVYAGSGVSRTNRTTEALCLDADDGSVVWRYPTDLPAWGSPAADGDDVFFGLGNGRLLTGPEPPEEPAGGLLCLTADGRFRWRFDAGDAVMGRAAVGPGLVFVGARDGGCHAIDRATGRPRWRHDLGSPVVTGPALLDGRLYVAASGGRVFCLDADTGRPKWTYDVAVAGAQTRLLSSPAVADEAGGRRLYFGAEVRNPTSAAAVLYCLREGR